MPTTFFPPSSVNCSRIREKVWTGASSSTEFHFAGELLAVTRGPLRKLLNMFKKWPKVLKLALSQGPQRTLGQLVPCPQSFPRRCWKHYWRCGNMPGCPFQVLVDIVREMPEATYNGSVLIDSTKGGPLQRLYLPTVAPWHAADFFTSVYKTELANMPPRCAKLMDVAGIAYKKKVDAIESSNVQTMKQASSYFTEVVAAIAAMFAIVKKYKKLPPVLTQSESARSICDIGFDDSLSQDEELATKGKDDAVEKLVSFWGRAVELSKQEGNEQPFLVIMAPPSCKAVDFLIYCQCNLLQGCSGEIDIDWGQNPGGTKGRMAALQRIGKDIHIGSRYSRLVVPSFPAATLGSRCVQCSCTLLGLAIFVSCTWTKTLFFVGLKGWRFCSISHSNKKDGFERLWSFLNTWNVFTLMESDSDACSLFFRLCILKVLFLRLLAL